MGAHGWGGDDAEHAKLAAVEEHRVPRVCGIPISVLSVSLLVVQTSGCTLVARLSRIQEGPRYLVSVAVLLTELVKLGVCVAAVTGQALHRRLSRRGRAPPLPTPTQLARQAAAYVSASVPIAFPALMFTAQSQLNLFAATGLDAVSFQVTNQLKILPTAFFSALYLHRHLSRRQWVSLPGLALGVAIVNSSTDGPLDSHGAARFGREWWLGLAAAVAAAVLSGYAGVYCERLLKTGTGRDGVATLGAGHGCGAAAVLAAAPKAAAGSHRISAPGEHVGGGAVLGGAQVGGAAARASISRCAECAERGALGACACTAAGRAAPRSPPRTPRARLSRLSVPLLLVRPVPRVPLLTLNIQLSAWGAALAGAQVLALHGPRPGTSGDARPGPLHGFGGYAWAVVGLQALGGLVVSVVILHTDNIIKGFAMAISILLSWLLSIPLFGLHPNALFVLGLALVLVSVVLFSAHKPHAAPTNQPGAVRRRISSTEHSDAGSGWAACLAEGDGLVLVALLTGAGVGLTVGMLWHSAHSGGGWASWLSAAP